MSEASMQVSVDERFNIQIGDELTQNVKPLLHEIRHALDKLLTEGDASIIDLRSIPLAPGEEDAILNTLGRGEVEAKLDALGTSEIVETRFAGVWIVTHRNDEDAVISRFIEVTTLPDILRSQHEDIETALDSLSQELAENLETN